MAFFLFLLVLAFSSLSLSSSSPSDTLISGHSLSGNTTIVSKRGRFEFGLFSPSASARYYLGIWYKNVKPRTVVWVANRETPLSDLISSNLKLENGTLVLTTKSSGKPIWSSSVSIPGEASNTTVAVLLDTGNLVLRDGSSSPNASDYLWQSFDHPTDTALSGSKLGQRWNLTSWKSPDDPSPGSYTLVFNTTGGEEFAMLWNGRVRYWASGKWDGKIFAGYPEMYRLHDYGIDRFNVGGAVYYSYVDHDPEGISGIVMSFTGLLTWQMWMPGRQVWLRLSLPRDPCDAFRRCGSGSVCVAFDPDCQCLPGFTPLSPSDWVAGVQVGGCLRTTRLSCGNAAFFEIAAVIELPDSSTRVVTGGRGEDYCASACSGDCSCSAYSYKNGSCLTWKEELFNLKLQSMNGTGGQLLRLRLAGSKIPTTVAGVDDGSGNRVVPIVAAIAGAALMGLAAIGYLLWRRQRRRRRRLESGTGLPVLYRYGDLCKVTNGFSESLGRGGFGSVYKGVLPDRSAVAVKRLEGLCQGDKQFRTEVAAMAAVQHVNVLRLRGFCCQGDSERLLVYDFLPNGSLDKYLIPGSSKILDWGTRFRIAIGVAKGLEYLHDKCRERVIHCDVKPENVLLDEGFRPQVADFGMAKLVGREFSRVLTTMRGTVGYLAPEWISGSPITEKADVYSFGMMLFEIASGRRNLEEVGDGSGDREVGFFPMWAARTAAEVEEPEVGNGVEVGEFRKACSVACWCVQDEAEQRPAMAEVVQLLEGVAERGPPPIPRNLRSLVPSLDSLVTKLSLHSLVDPQNTRLEVYRSLDVPE